MPDPAAPTPDLDRRVPEGFVLLAALIALVPAGKAVLYDTIDPDCWIHLHIADQLVRDGVGPIVDEHSYMTTKEPWTPYSWLAELGMKVLWDRFGYRAGIVCQAFMAACLVVLVLRTCLIRVRAGAAPLPAADNAMPAEGAPPGGGGGVYFNAGLFTAFATYMSTPYLSFRPVTLALVLMSVCLWLHVRDRAAGERTRAAWLVIPLTALIVNVHLYAILVPAWLGALWAGSLRELSRAPNDARAEARRRALRYTLMTVGTALACLATPMLPGAVRSIVYYQFGDAMVGGMVVKEYLPFYHGPAGIGAAVLVVMGLLCVAVGRRKLRTGEVFWLLGSVVLLMRMGRFAPVFAMVAAPIFAAAAPRLPDRVLGRTPVRLALVVVLGAGLFRVVTLFPGPGVTLDGWMNRHGPTMLGYPSNAAAFVEQKVPRRTGRLINEYNWGGYLGWRLAPRFQVLLDGRTHLYPPGFWRATYLGTPEEAAALLQSVGADAAILPQGSTLFQPLLEGMGWTRPYYDGFAVVLVPPGTKVDLPEELP